MHNCRTYIVEQGRQQDKVCVHAIEFVGMWVSMFCVGGGVFMRRNPVQCV